MYTYTSKQILVEDGQGNKRRKTKTVMGECIGSITEKDGYIPNAGHISDSIITGRNYGNYAVALNYSSDTYNKLCSVFHPDDARYQKKNQYFNGIEFSDGFIRLKRQSTVDI